ncbi:MAG: DNA-protecting protein DprA [Planctomycetes bacterium]|nr:DNA-protecting protein DprA [Planctomycetota bacterium]
MIATIEVKPEEVLGPLNETEKKNAPERLYLAGDIELLRRGVRVSIVGTRHPSEEGLRRTGKLAGLLVKRDVVVVSGLAEGIDTAAHQSTMAASGRTVAVIGTPLDGCFPPQNTALQERIRSEHLLVSQFPPGHPTMKKNFPMRNRTMALITDATVIVEAKDGSGTLHQGWEALRLGRPLFIMDSLLEDKTLAWTKEMLSYGAEILSDEELEVFFERLPEGSRNERIDLPF